MNQEDFVRKLVAVQGALRGFILTYVKDPDRVEDILQDVSVVLWKKLDSFQADRPFLSWALGVARNEILHSRREACRSRLIFEPDLFEKAAGRYDALEPELAKRRAALRHCIEKLPPHYREVVEHRYLDAQPISEVARRVKKSDGAVHMLLSRIRQALTACADRYLAGGSPEVRS